MNNKQIEKETENGLDWNWIITGNEADISLNGKYIDTVNLEKRYEFEVNLIFDEILYARNLKEAREQLKETFRQDYNIEVMDSEINQLK